MKPLITQPYRLPAVAGIGVLAITAGLWAVTTGPTAITLAEALRATLSGWFKAGPAAETGLAQTIVFDIRLPRVVLGLGVGASLALAGAIFQALFRNPLADPGLIGVSSGAALGAVLAILLGLGAGMAGIIPVALAGGLATAIIVYRLAQVDGQINLATLLLTGIAINALAGAGIGFAVFLADDDQLRAITFWSLGSLAGAHWQLAAQVGLCLLPLVLLIPKFARTLNALLLGEAEAFHLGIDTRRAKGWLLTGGALVTAAAVATCGVIGFVGLVTPHLVRLLLGPDHRWLLPACALLGGALLVGADLLARTVAAPAELPIGIVTAALGAPFFLGLLLQTRRHLA
ncbi:MAG: FecCD family ABC transporter permease [Opitutales bacterium]